MEAPGLVDALAWYEDVPSGYIVVHRDGDGLYRAGWPETRWSRRARQLDGQFLPHERLLLEGAARFFEAVNTGRDPSPARFYVRDAKARTVAQQQDLRTEGTVARHLVATSAGGGSDTIGEFPLGQCPGVNQYIRVTAASRRVTRTKPPTYITKIEAWEPAPPSSPNSDPNLNAVDPKKFLSTTTDLEPRAIHGFVGAIIGGSTVADRSRTFVAGNSDTTLLSISLLVEGFLEITSGNENATLRSQLGGARPSRARHAPRPLLRAALSGRVRGLPGSS